MHYFTLKFLLFLTLPLFLVSSCAKAPPQTALSPARILEAKRSLERPKEFFRLSAFVQASLKYRGKTESFDAALLVERPDRLRIDLIDDLGQTSARFIADGETVLWHDLRNGTEERFAQTDSALKKVLRLPLSVEEFIARMTLQIPPDEILQAWPEAGGERVDRSNDRILLGPDGEGMIGYERKKRPLGKKLSYRVVYQNFNSDSFPLGMEWEFLSPRYFLQLRLSQVDLNGPIPAGRWDTSKIH